MTWLRTTYLFLLLAGLLFSNGYGQTTYLGDNGDTIINTYASVEIIHTFDRDDIDSVTLFSLPADPEPFLVGDTVLLYVTKGAGIQMTGTDDEQGDEDTSAPEANKGKYAILIIDGIDGNTIIFNNALNNPEESFRYFRPLASGETAQLIKMKSYPHVVVRGDGITARAWDGETGGILAMFVNKKLRLEADIDVSGKGFRGAVDAANYVPLCSSTDTLAYDSSFYNISSTKAGLKGEGITNTGFTLMRGKAKNINGGGGGNGRFSGGGGGGNYARGGSGGYESTSPACYSGLSDPRAYGGFGLEEYYYVNENEGPVIFNLFDRVFLGGGGGAGTREEGDNERHSTPGGDGAGIVIIFADSIEAVNGHGIIANGAGVVGVTGGAGGGGGAGGAILLDVNHYQNLELSAVGGKGGDTFHASDTTGPGGGGGGGIYWIAGDEDDHETGISTSLLAGQPGRHLSPEPFLHGARTGGKPRLKDGLRIPLRGLIFNPVPTEFWACSDMVPEAIIAANPKGGHGNFTFQWVDSSKTQNSWEIIAGADTKDLLFDAPLSDTTYYRRIVTEKFASGDSISTTSSRIALYVHQAITGNTIRASDGLSVSDEVCNGLAPLPFVPTGMLANGNTADYAYRWVYHEGDDILADGGGVNDTAGYAAPALLNPGAASTATYFSRIVTSGACIDTSQEILVTVHPSLDNFDISPEHDTICWNTTPRLLDGGVPGGGKDGDKRYRWESSALESGPWSPLGEDTEDYQAGQLTETTWFRRVALSGIGTGGDACEENSNAVEVVNVDTIENNLILSLNDTVCILDTPALLDASAPGGGNGEYRFWWESRGESSGSWVPAEPLDANDMEDFQPPVMDGESIYYRRVTGSGGPDVDVCQSVSNEIFVKVYPAITDNVIQTADTIKCQGDLLDDLLQGGSESSPGGGATEGGVDPSRNYKWEMAIAPEGGSPGANDWSQISYGPDELNYTANPVLDTEDDYWYRRIVFSGPPVSGQEQVCADTTKSTEEHPLVRPVHIVVHTAISDYEIEAVDSACHLSIKTLFGDPAQGETDSIPAYQWREVGGSDLPGTAQNYDHHFANLGPYELERFVRIGECTATSAPMIVTVMELPGATLSADIAPLCEADTVLNLAFNTPGISNFDAPWKVYLYDGINMAPSDTSSFERAALDAGNGKFRLALETHNNEPGTQYNYTLAGISYTTADGEICISAADDPASSILLQGNVQIEVYNKPNPSIYYTPGEELSLDSICGSFAELMMDADYGTGSWFSDPDAYMSFDETSDSTTTVAIEESQEAWAIERYHVYFRSEAGDCADTAQVELFFYEQPEPAFAGRDTTVFLSNSLMMNADPATAGIGTWTLQSGSGVIVDLHDPNTLITGLEKNGENAFQWTVENGCCNTTSSVSIVTQREVWRPEGISPNDDCLNDYFIFRGLNDADDFTIRFFNSLGRTVRTITGDNQDELIWDPSCITGGLAENEMVVWDGRSENGNLVTAGTYYYVVNMTITQKDGDRDTYEYKDYIVVRD